MSNAVLEELRGKVLCLRLAPPGFPGERLDHLQIEIHGRINAAGQRSVSITRLGGATVLRLVAVSLRLTESATNRVTMIYDMAKMMNFPFDYG